MYSYVLLVYWNALVWIFTGLCRENRFCQKKQKIIDCLYLSMIYLSHMLIHVITNGLKLGEKSGPKPNVTYINEYAHWYYHGRLDV
jgi:hypothetical protein